MENIEINTDSQYNIDNINIEVFSSFFPGNNFPDCRLTL